MIRFGRVEDVPTLIELGKVMHEESQYREFSYVPEKVEAMLRVSISENEGCLFVAENEDGKVIGAILGWVSEFWFGDDMMICDLALFIEPAARGGMTAARLIKRFLRYGEEIGVKQVTLSNSTMVEMDRVAKLYERMGMTRLGYVYTHTCERE